jgi:uncharacterized protein (DUF486 family)
MIHLLIVLLIFAVVAYLVYTYVPDRVVKTIIFVIWGIMLLAWLLEVSGLRGAVE